MKQVRQEPLPKWMEQAIKDKVISRQEGRAIHRVASKSDEEWVVLPESLHEAAKRINLWQMPCEATLH